MKDILNKIEIYINKLPIKELLERNYQKYHNRFLNSMQYPYDKYAWGNYLEQYNNLIKRSNFYYDLEIPLLMVENKFELLNKINDIEKKYRNMKTDKEKIYLNILKNGMDDYSQPNILKKEISRVECIINNKRACSKIINKINENNDIRVFFETYEEMFLKLIVKEFKKQVEEKTGYLLKYSSKSLFKDFEQTKSKSYKEDLLLFLEKSFKYTLVSRKRKENILYELTVQRNENVHVSIVKRYLDEEKKEAYLNKLKLELFDNNPDFGKQIRFLERINSYEEYDNNFKSNHTSPFIQQAVSEMYDNDDYIKPLNTYFAIGEALKELKTSSYHHLYDESIVESNLTEDLFGLTYEKIEVESKLSKLAGISYIPESYKGLKENEITKLYINDLLIYQSYK